eukprot:1195946-Prorocentrum_minimum.AAC.2
MLELPCSNSSAMSCIDNGPEVEKATTSFEASILPVVELGLAPSSVPLQAGPNPDGFVPNKESTSEVVNGHGV